MTDDGTVQMVSPSSLNTIVTCGLAQFQRTKITGTANPQRSNPPARLGDAAHQVLEWVANEVFDGPGVGFETQAATKWSEALDRQAEASRANQLELAFGPPETWPRVALTEQSTLLEAARLAEELADVPQQNRMPEWKVQSDAHSLRGTVDLCITTDNGDARIIDYKAGKVDADDAAPGGRYFNQVVLYAALVREQDLYPTTAEIRPIGRRPTLIDLTSTMIDQALDAARAVRDEYNAKVSSGAIEELARPSEQACKWCEFAPTCKPLWSAEAESLGDFWTTAGEVTKITTSRRGSYEIRISSDEGRQTGELAVARLDPARLPALETLEVGVRIRATGLAQAAPGSTTLVAKNSTILIPDQ